MLQDNSGNRSLRIPGPESGEMKAIQTVLEVSSVFWKPIRDFVSLAIYSLITRPGNGPPSYIWIED